MDDKDKITTIIEELRKGQLFLAPARHGVVDIIGPEARDFLQRLLTADFSGFHSGSKLSCLVNNKGRMIDLVLVIAHQGDNFSLISSFPSGETLLNWLESFHFIENFSLSLAPKLASLVLSQTGSDLNFSLELDQKLSLVSLDLASFETLRIAALRPGARELSGPFMPHNIGLGHLVSAHKGCYLGQEVLAKALTYQKHPKLLAGFKLSPRDFELAQPGDRISDQGEFSGFISSLSPIYLANYPNGLAIIEKSDQALGCHASNAQFIFS